VKEGVKVETLGIGSDVGSDHLPVLAKVCVDPISEDADVGSLLPSDS
jgi:hypothetical protein